MALTVNGVDNSHAHILATISNFLHCGSPTSCRYLNPYTKSHTICSGSALCDTVNTFRINSKQNRYGAMFVWNKQTCYITTLSKNNYTESCWRRSHDFGLPVSANSYQLQWEHVRNNSGAFYWITAQRTGSWEQPEWNGASASLIHSNMQ